MASSPGTDADAATVVPAWPPLALADWADTCATLHMWMQIVGKVALAQSPPLNHSWGAAMHLTPRGLSTLLLPYGQRSFTIEFDLVEHQLLVTISPGDVHRMPLRSQPVADFYAQFMTLLRDLSMPVRIWPVAVEVPRPIRLDQDVEHHTYDPEAANRFWRVLAVIAPVFNRTRCEYVGKSSPVHFFWGSMDLAVTRFSGRKAPAREGPAFMREAYSHEVISAGFWPGNAAIPEPAFYSYAAPEPPGLKDAAVLPPAAYYHRDLGEFILPYDAVRTSADPPTTLRSFTSSVYEQAATLGGWDRPALERRRVVV